MSQRKFMAHRKIIVSSNVEPRLSSTCCIHYSLSMLTTILMNLLSLWWYCGGIIITKRLVCFICFLTRAQAGVSNPISVLWSCTHGEGLSIRKIVISSWFALVSRTKLMCETLEESVIPEDKEAQPWLLCHIHSNLCVISRCQLSLSARTMQQLSASLKLRRKWSQVWILTRVSPEQQQKSATSYLSVFFFSWSG